MQRTWRSLALAGVVAVGGSFGLASNEARAQFPIYETQTIVTPAETVVGGGGYVVRERRKLFRPRTSVTKVRPLGRTYFAPATSTTTTIIEPAPEATTTVIESAPTTTIVEPVPEPVTATSYIAPLPTRRVLIPSPTLYRVDPR